MILVLSGLSGSSWVKDSYCFMSFMALHVSVISFEKKKILAANLNGRRKKQGVVMFPHWPYCLCKCKENMKMFPPEYGL